MLVLGALEAGVFVALVDLARVVLKSWVRVLAPTRQEDGALRTKVRRCGWLRVDMRSWYAAGGEGTAQVDPVRYDIVHTRYQTPAQPYTAYYIWKLPKSIPFVRAKATTG